MTIAVMYKLDNKAVFINDFRVTNSGLSGIQQVDAMNKFRKINNNMAIFLAGNVNHWKMALEAIENIKEDITIDNVLDSEGPLKIALQSCLEIIPGQSNQILGAIGVLVEPNTKKNITFQIRGEAGLGCNVYEVPNNTCLVIGSGSSIPDIQNRIQRVAVNLTKDNKYNLFELANSLRAELKLIFKLCGASSFRKLGVSPVFAISILESSAFQMCGEEIKGSFYSSTNEMSREHHYTYNMEDGSPILFDHISKKKVQIKDIYDYSPATPSNLFDPENLTIGFDPTVAFNGDNNMYIINQWVHRSMKDLDLMYKGVNSLSDLFSIDRVVYRVENFRYNGEILCNPNYIKLAEDFLEDIPLSEAEKYNNIGYHNLILKKDTKEENFGNLIKLNVYNHQWLRNQIENYFELFKD
ncbi:hypothetical protein [Fictibacillus sp. FJAT-27399]|uniref:hypothetical protein n=1 Tax=Fictibacillus sp. FJAT-27399 TaxID=1729689 RepID=UPI000784DBD7|nr:hypothetical protein [Fictibacillus sp. FJAT-27399]